MSLTSSGLPASESAMMGILLELANDRLDAPWQLVDGDEGDAILFDPRSSGSRRKGGASIAVLDAETPVPESASACLYRPLRIDPLVHVLNSVAAGSPAATPSTTQAGSSATQAPLAEILRRAVQDSEPDTVRVVEGIGDGPLVIEAGRDRLRGPTDAIDIAGLAEGTHCTVREQSRAQAAGLASSASERPLHAFLWELAHGDDSGRALFGDAERTLARLVRWPRLTEVGASRTQMRALSVLRKRRATVADLHAATGIARRDLVRLFNAAWLTGALETAGERAPRTNNTNDGGRAARRNGSLAARLRDRLGMR